MNKIIIGGMPFVSIIAILSAPAPYDFSFCLIMNVLYLILFSSYWIRTKKEGYIRFSILFSICFYFVNFVYPVLIYPLPHLRYFSMFGTRFNEDIINYSTAVALCAYSFFILGICYKVNKRKIEQNSNSIQNNYLTQNQISFYCKILTYMLIIGLMAFFYFDGLSYFTEQFSYGAMEKNTIGGYIFAFLQPLIMVLLIFLFLKNNKQTLSFIFPFTLIYLLVFGIMLTGSRTFPLIVLLITIGLYNDRVKKIKITQAIVGIIIFAVVMTLVGSLRGGGETISSATEEDVKAVLYDKEYDSFIIQYFRGLIINNHSLYTLIDYAETNSYTYGLTLIGTIVGIVPFGQSIFCNLTGIPSVYISSASFNTLITIGTGKFKGMGTNSVSDIYVTFGLLGVILVFFFFGRICEYIRKKRYISIYYFVTYYIILSDAVYISRSTIFQLLKQVLWGCFFIWIIHILTNTRSIGKCNVKVSDIWSR